MDARQAGYAFLRGRNFLLAEDKVDRNKRLHADAGAKKDGENIGGQFVKEASVGVEARNFEAKKTDEKHKRGPQKGKLVYKKGKELHDRFSKGLPTLKEATLEPPKRNKSGNREDGNYSRYYASQFAHIQRQDATTMDNVSVKDCFKRADKAIEYGKAKRDFNKDPRYEWTIDGKKLSADEAFTLEEALIDIGQSFALATGSSDVHVRRDFYNARGQISVANQTKNGKTQRVFDRSHVTIYTQKRDQYRHTEMLIGRHSEFIDELAKDVSEGRREAMLAYFIHRTSCRSGSQSTDTGSVGASQLTEQNVTVHPDHLMFKFHAKNGMWEVKVEDEILQNFVRKRLEEIKAGGKRYERLFGTTYYKLNKYLNEVSDRLGIEDKFSPHDFRRVNATMVARRYMEQFPERLNSKDDKEYLKLAMEATNKAADTLNDSAGVTFEKYVVPSVLLKERPHLGVMYEKSNNGIGTNEDVD